MKDTAIVILNYNTWKDTLQEVQCVQVMCKVDAKDIIIVDNASPNNAYERLYEENVQGYILLKAEKNVGYAAGNNIALKYAVEKGYRYAWILNNDILIDDKEIWDKLICVLKRDSSVAVVSPDIYAPDGHMFNRDAVRPSFYDLTLGMLSYRQKGRELEDKGGYGYVYRPQGCCMLLDLAKISEVGYLDEHTFLYCEEIILAERLREKGYFCACCSDTKVIHNHSKTVRSTMQKKEILRMKQTSFRYYLTKYRGYGTIKCILASWCDTLKWKLLG